MVSEMKLLCIRHLLLHSKETQMSTGQCFVVSQNKVSLTCSILPTPDILEFLCFMTGQVFTKPLPHFNEWFLWRQHSFSELIPFLYIWIL